MEVTSCFYTLDLIRFLLKNFNFRPDNSRNNIRCIPNTQKAHVIPYLSSNIAYRNGQR